MSELTLTLIKLGFLAILWIFVLSTVSVIRSDLFGAKVEASTPEKTKAARPGKPAKAAKRNKKAPGQLVVVGGADAGVSVPLHDLPILIGRGNEATIRLDDDYVSTRHARFVRNDDRWFLEDLGSTNGTYLGSQRVTAPVEVALGTQVRIGKSLLELRK